ncbi:Trm112 family protein [Nisaea acidiphila]|uniref:UPF0434 protein NUH88_11235 n=1 Tax=Nisaea acidiphila TaxID=1862145 RepID=A0A9J7AKH7_9PROT|nr:Trm112 family protein [Nisaea acidiphila]UUX47992.1 Trm112 family protein [Nisaea acidiphila]
MHGTDKPAAGAAEREVDPKLLEILVCPVTKAPLTYDRERSELVSEQARLAYPIRDGVPIMLPDEARHLDDDRDPVAEGAAAIKIVSDQSAEASRE